MEKFTNPIRSYIEKNFEELFMVNGDMELTIETYAKAFYLYFLALSDHSLDIENTIEYKCTNVFYTNLCQTAFLDAYKEFSYKIKHLDFDNTDLLCFIDLEDMNDFDDVYSVISYNPYLFNRMLESIYNFQERSYLEKIIRVRSLSEGDNQKLLEIAPAHEFDLKTYGKNNPITFKELLDYYDYKYKHFSEESSSNDYALVLTFVSFIRELSLVDKDNALYLLTEIAKKDYVTSKYLRDKLVITDEYEDHIRVYEDLEYNDIIDVLLSDEDFLVSAFYNVIDLLINKSRAGENLDESKINVNANKEVIKKLERKIK